jgi:hypothetical protein
MVACAEAAAARHLDLPIPAVFLLIDGFAGVPAIEPNMPRKTKR